MTRSVSRRSLAILLLAAAAMLLPHAARAQVGLNLIEDAPSKTQEERDKDKERDDAYRAAQKKIPAQQQAADPWGNIREPAKPAAKTAATPVKKQAGTAKQ